MTEVRHIESTRVDQKGKALCGRTIGMVFCFQSIDHVYLTLKEGTCITPCRACLKNVKAIIDKELGC